MKSYLFAVFLFIFSQSTVCSQQRTIDSLKKIISGKYPEPQKLDALYDILNYVPSSECEKYNDQMMVLSEHFLKNKKKNSVSYKKYAPFLAESYYNKGVFLSNRNNADSAILYYKKGITAHKAINDQTMLAYCYMNMAIILTTKGTFSQATALLYKALAIHEKNKDFEGIGDTYMHIGRVYHMQKYYDKAFYFMNKANTAYNKAKYNIGILETLYKMAQIETDRRRFKAAMTYLNKSISLSDKLKIKDQNKQQQLLIACKGYIAFQKNQTDSVVYYFKKSIDLANNSNNTYLLGSRYMLLSRAYYFQKKYKEATKYGVLSLQTATETKDLDLQWNTTKLLTQIYKADNKPLQALTMQDQYLKINDSIRSVAEKKRVWEQQLKYEFDKKELLQKVKHEKEMDALFHDTEKNNLKKNIGILLLLVFLISITTIAYLINRQQKQKNIIERQNSNLLKQKMLLSQMNPHFIFNAINSIQNYILQKKELDAYSYLAKFSKLIRMVLSNSTKNYIALHEEIDLLKTYVEIEQLRFENTFDFILEIDNQINEQEYIIPPMLIQPYVENAIWHGIMNLEKNQKGKLTLSFKSDKNGLVITVEDNGIGRKQTQDYKPKTHQPLGMNLTEQRLTALQELSKNEHINIVITDLYDTDEKACGTKVTIYLSDNFHL
ncbi:tetratricopeptide repeat-containing sensor histidine kinase [Flavobacterium sp. TBRC 19031]|uniref:tetratricopeptide repeat-containing sensor histidine kinase n=1 Tax=Flavobacterium mekongense TaxID=3379707 RepID=UPI00399A58C3